MNGSVETAFVQMIVGIIGGVGGVCVLVLPAFGAYLKGKIDLLAKQQGANTARLTSLENGGGDAKIDTRLAQHGVPLTPDLPPTRLDPGGHSVEIVAAPPATSP